MIPNIFLPFHWNRQYGKHYLSSDSKLKWFFLYEKVKDSLHCKIANFGKALTLLTLTYIEAIVSSTILVSGPCSMNFSSYFAQRLPPKHSLLGYEDMPGHLRQ